jgi:hypothetical protein
MSVSRSLVMPLAPTTELASLSDSNPGPVQATGRDGGVEVAFAYMGRRNSNKRPGVPLLQIRMTRWGACSPSRLRSADLHPRIAR